MLIPADAPKWRRLDRAALAVILVCGLAILIRQNWTAAAQLHEMESSAARAGLVIMPGAGDVPARDVPKVHEFLHGRFFSDPHFEGESVWYPFIHPLLVAATCKLSGSDISRGYPLAGIILVTLFLIAATLALSRFGGLPMLWLVPLAFWMKWLVPGPAMYPWESARLALAFFFFLSALVMHSLFQGRPRAGLLVSFGAWTGLLSLWSGASFFAAVPVTCILGSYGLISAYRRGEFRPALRGWLLAGCAALAVFSLLAVPQLLQYHALKQATSARLYLPDDYYHGGRALINALSLPLRPPQTGAWVILVFFLVLAAWPLSRGTPAFREIGIPTAIAYGTCMLLTHAGFGQNDPTHPWVAELIRRYIPAPASTFYILAAGSFPYLPCCGGVYGLLLLAKAGMERLRPRFPYFLEFAWARRRALGVLASALSFMILVPTFPAGVAFNMQTEKRAYVAFAAKVEKAAGDGSVFVRNPLRLTTAAGVRPMLFDFPDHANHYILGQRLAAVARLDAALAQGRFPEADKLLAQFDVRVMVADPKVPGDRVLAMCAGPAIAEYEGFQLRARRPCSR